MVSTPRFVAIVQELVDGIYPDFEHKVQLYGDSILLSVSHPLFSCISFCNTQLSFSRTTD